VPFGQPVFPCDFPDPTVLRIGRLFYAYGTSTGWQSPGRVFPILGSRDLRRWRHVGNALPRVPRWARGDLWAPSVLRARGRYLLYYSALRRRDRNHCLAVATSLRAVGPFQDRGPIACRDRRGAGYIDAAPLMHRGRGYLFFSVDRPRHSISVLRLRPDLLRAQGRRRPLLRVRRRWHRGLRSETVEGPSPVRRNGRVYLFYSAGCWCRDYRMGYAVARHPLGPYRDARENPILKGKRGLAAPGGGSVVRDRGGRDWLAFHAWTRARDYRWGGMRTLRMARVRWSRRRPRIVLSRIR
jgi:beta-xylosidase